MQDRYVHLNNEHSVGLGDNLCLLSALAVAPKKVHLYVNNDHNTYNRLVQYAKIFRIPKSELEITETAQNGNFPNTGWPVKLFNSYTRPVYVNVNGQVLKIDHEVEKKCVAIAGFYEKPSEGQDPQEWPWCKRRDLEYWQRIFSWLKSMDYEVITLDRAGFDLENKIEIMVKYCKAIISYEGGMAHLAHMLRLPCFLVDWKLPSPSTTLGEFHCDFVHKSETVYIVRNDEEFFGWDANKFGRIVHNLKNSKSNNRFLQGTHKIIFEKEGLQGNIKVVERSGDRVVLEAPPIYGDNPMTAFVAENFWNNLSKNI